MTKSALIKNLRSNPRKLFLIDGLGAILTAFMLGVVFVNYQEFSFTCFIKAFKNWGSI